jgi:hypothetical protein
VWLALTWDTCGPVVADAGTVKVTWIVPVCPGSRNSGWDVDSGKPTAGSQGSLARPTLSEPRVLRSRVLFWSAAAGLQLPVEGLVRSSPWMEQLLKADGPKVPMTCA